MSMDANGNRRRHFLGAAAAALAAAGIGVGYAKAQMTSTNPPDGVLPSEGNLPSLDGATGWLNSGPLTRDDLRGKVVVVNFWTYTCVNWLRQLPYVRAWAEKYRDQGLVVIGVHTPEFSFEHDIDNVQQAAMDMRVDYPISIDNEYAVWEAFTNRYWPALYFVDAMGRIRHHYFGEGAYDESEQVIQQLLREAGANDIGPELVSVDPRGAEVAADWADLESGENYLGLERTENFASSGDGARGDSQLFTPPTTLRLNQWALAGNWTLENERVVLNEANGRIAYQFHARDLNLVMAPTSRGMSIQFRVSIDGLPPGAAHGFDVDEQGIGTLSEQRVYQLIRQPSPIAERRFEIEFLDSGVGAYSFTFG